MTEAANAVADAVTKMAVTKNSLAQPPPTEPAAPSHPPAQQLPAQSTPPLQICPISRRYGAPVRASARERNSALWRAWRLVGMPIFYPLFAVGCGAGLVGAALIRLSVPSPGARVLANRRLLSAITRRWLWFGCFLRLLEWEALRPASSALDAGRSEPEAMQPGRLLVANHPTLIDVLFLVALEPELCCVLKADLNRNWAYARLIRELDYLSNADPERLLAEGAERLRRGESLLVFPEGTRTIPGRAVAFRQGAAAIAIRAGVPVHPVLIEYQGAYLSKGYPWYALPKQRVRYRFRFGLPLHSPPFSSGAAAADRNERRRARRQLNAALERYMNEGLQASSLPLPAEQEQRGLRGKDTGNSLSPLQGADL